VLTVDDAAGGAAGEAGTGDERIRGITGTAVTTLSVRRAATGVTRLTVTQNGGGSVYLDAPAGEAHFALFEGAGFVELSDMPNAENNGWFEVTLKPSNDRLHLLSTTMVTATGLGSERCHQSQFRRSSGSFAADGLLIGHRVEAGGFAQRIESAVFTVRAVSDSAVGVDDPFGLLATEAGTGAETLTVVRVPLAYEVDTTLASGSLQLQVTVPIRPGTKSVVATEELEARYRLRDRATGRLLGGWITEDAVPASAASITFGPVPADSDADFAFRAISREKTSSDWCVLTGTGPADRPATPTVMQVRGDAVMTAEGSEFALRVEWS
jgi:hypothetical protein